MIAYRVLTKWRIMFTIGEAIKIALQLFHVDRERAEIHRSQKYKSVLPSFIDNDPCFSETCDAMTKGVIFETILSFGIMYFV